MLHFSLLHKSCQVQIQDKNGDTDFAERRIVEEQYQKMGMVYDPTATAERAQQMVGECLRAHGIKPEDNDASHGIIAARDDY